MRTMRLPVHTRSRRISGLWLPARCIAVLVVLVFVLGHVSAHEPPRPQPPVAQAAPPAPLAEAFEVGENGSNYYIFDPTGSGCGPTTTSPIYISSAPSGATVTKVVYFLVIEHDDVDDLEVWLQNPFHSQTVWDVPESPADTDGGLDDDPEDDHDIELWRTIYSTFDGDQVNQTWSLKARDCNKNGDDGAYDYWSIFVYYDCAGLTPATPSGPSPADGATDQLVTVDLDWDNAEHATSYDVYFGTSASPPKVGTATSSNYALGTLAAGTRYYWKIVAKNKCAETTGPVWDFTTQGTPTATSTPTRTRTATPTVTPSATRTMTRTPQPTRTASRTPLPRGIYLPVLLRQT